MNKNYSKIELIVNPISISHCPSIQNLSMQKLVLKFESGGWKQVPWKLKIKICSVDLTIILQNGNLIIRNFRINGNFRIPYRLQPLFSETLNYNFIENLIYKNLQFFRPKVYPNILIAKKLCIQNGAKKF